MTQINNPAVVSEVTKLYLKYEQALCSNDVETLIELFWDAAEVVRFGATENLYGSAEIQAFRHARFQKGSPANLEREMFNLKVVTFNDNMAAVTLEFRRKIGEKERLGRQSQMWHKFSEGWKIVS
ncbi:MAG: DUF3225 domain-containing protein, partial [Desertifilum sp. SIO1I2]|nr:DUF3225 domain-containing protein [Desertifilum sp. SIO1I2]